jgi:hypothetical protein
MKTSFRGIPLCLAVASVGLIGCRKTEPLDLKRSCPSWTGGPQLDQHSCVGSTQPSKCCTESEGFGVDFESVAVQVEPTQLSSIGIDPQSIVSEATALCIAETQGLSPIELGSNATLTISEGKPRWTVTSWSDSNCNEHQPGELGHNYGCGIIIDGKTGIPQFAAEVTSTSTCQ